MTPGLSSKENAELAEDTDSSEGDRRSGEVAMTVGAEKRMAVLLFSERRSSQKDTTTYA